MSFTYDRVVYNDHAAHEIVPLLIDLFHPLSVVDVGCGLGDWLKVFSLNGVTTIQGIDSHELGKNQLSIDQSQYLSHDLCNPLSYHRRFDLALCLEVAEHLPTSCANQLVETITQLSDTIIFSAAIPDQGGQGHLNEQPPEYWEKLFNKKGYHYHDVLRNRIWNNQKIEWWYKQNIFVVTNRFDQAMASHDVSQSNLYVHPELFYSSIKGNSNNENKGVLLTSKLLLKAIRLKITGKQK